MWNFGGISAKQFVRFTENHSVAMVAGESDKMTAEIFPKPHGGAGNTLCYC
jgi:hypothetical protein